MADRRDAAAPARDVTPRELTTSSGDASDTFYLYLHTTLGDDDNAGFGTSDPTDPSNWSGALKTTDAVRRALPYRGDTYVITQGDIHFAAETIFPYSGYRAHCVLVAYDAMTPIATGTIAGFTAPGSGWRRPYGQITWNGGYVSSDAELRKYWLAIETDSGRLPLVKVNRFDAPNTYLAGEPNYFGAISGGNAVSLLSLTPTITIDALLATVNTQVIGYNIVGNGTVEAFGHEFYQSSKRCGFAACSFEQNQQAATPILLAVYGNVWTDGADTAVEPLFAGGAFDFNIIPTIANVPGCYIKPASTATAYRRIQANRTSEFHLNSSVIDDVYVEYQDQGYFYKTRQVDSAVSKTVAFVNSSLHLYDAEVSRLEQYTGADVYFQHPVRASSDSSGSDPVWYIDGGNVFVYQSPHYFFEVTGSASDRKLVDWRSATTSHVCLQGGSDLATPGTPMEAVAIIGGYHTELTVDLDSVDRGAGATVKVSGGAEVDLVDFTCPSREYLEIDGAKVTAQGDLSLGSAASKLDKDAKALYLLNSGALSVAGAFTVYRNVASASHLAHIVTGGKLSAGGNVTMTHEGGGDSYGAEITTGGQILLDGGDITITTDADGGTYSTPLYMHDGGSLLGDSASDMFITATGSSIYPTYIDSSTLKINSVTVTADNSSAGFGLFATVNSDVIVGGTLTVNGASADDYGLTILSDARCIVVYSIIVNMPNSTKCAVYMRGGASLTRSKASETFSITVGTPAAGERILHIDELCKFRDHGTVDLAACGVGNADGSFIKAFGGSQVHFNKIKFAGASGELPMGAFATLYADEGATVWIDGATTCLNSTNPGAPTCTGVRLDGGARLFAPAWNANSGMGAKAAAANGRDQKIGGGAVGNWGGSETIVDAATQSMAHKP